MFGVSNVKEDVTVQNHNVSIKHILSGSHVQDRMQGVSS